MKLEIENIRFKNFFSYGQKWQELEFKNGLNLVLGNVSEINRSNGSGKSSLAETIPFALFGKVQKEVNLDDIVNWKNKKNCEVEMSFKLGRDKFKILRCLRPNNLEVFKNDVPIGEFSDKREYQKWLEDEVININFQTFTSLIYMNLNRSGSILSMKKPDKRAFMERLFSLHLFKQINDLCNKKLTASIEKLRSIDASIESNSNIKKMLTEQLSNLSAKLVSMSSSKNELLKIEDDLKIEQETLNKLENIDMASIKSVENLISNEKIEIEEIEEQISSIVSERNIYQTSIDKIEALNDDAISRLKKMKGENKCPLCWSEIDIKNIEDVISKDNAERCLRLEELNLKKETLNESIKTLKLQISDMRNEIDKLHDKLKEISTHNMHVIEIKGNISNLENSIILINEKIQIEEKTKSEITSELEDVNQKLKDIEISTFELSKNKTNISKIMDYVDFIKTICKDDAVKQYAISSLIPYVNKQMNYYLSEVGQSFYVILDKWLESEIKGPGISSGTYGNLSGGEMKSVDLACQQSMIDIVKMMSTIWPDVMIFDELLDSSLDSMSLEKILDIVRLKQIDENSKTFIISHRKEISEMDFDNIYLIEKSNGFSNLIKL